MASESSVVIHLLHRNQVRTVPLSANTSEWPALFAGTAGEGYDREMSPVPVSS